jgi:hypothetical protein
VRHGGPSGFKSVSARGAVRGQRVIDFLVSNHDIALLRGAE